MVAICLENRLAMVKVEAGEKGSPFEVGDGAEPASAKTSISEPPTA
jgi:hypothetical protein